MHKHTHANIHKHVLVFNWNHFEMRLLNLRIFYFLFIADFFVLILVVWVFLCVVSSFTTFRPNFTSGLLQMIFTATSDRNAESCNRIPSNYCLP